jgi:hypothetical protein
MRLLAITLLALLATSWAQTANSWFFIENYDSTGCTGDVLVFGYRADGTCHPNPPGSFIATCTGGTPSLQTCSDTECEDCTDGTPPTTCTAGEGIFQKATCSNGSYPNGPGYVLKYDYTSTSTCTDTPFRLTYLPLGCTTTASFGATSANYECRSGVAYGESCTTDTCGSCTSLSFTSTCSTNMDSDLKSTHTCTSAGTSTPTAAPTSGTPTTTTPTAPSATPRAPQATPTSSNSPTTVPANNTPNSAAKISAAGFALGAIVLAL